MAKSPAALIVDASGNTVGVLLDGSVYRLQTEAKLATGHGLATEATLADIKAKTDNIPTQPSQEHATAASPHAARLTDGTSFYKATTPADTQPISAASLPLPSGAATDAALATLLSELQQKTEPADQQLVTPVTSATGTVTSVTAATSDTTLLASNASRKGMSVYNDSNAVLYLKTGSGASTTSFTVAVRPHGYWECPFNHTGQINGIWSGANGAARVTEYT